MSYSNGADSLPPDSLEGRVELVEGKADELIKDLRDTKLWRTRMETKVDVLTRSVDTVDDKVDGLEVHMLELLSIAKGADMKAVDAAKAARIANRKVKLAQARADAAEARGSWTNEVAEEAARAAIHVNAKDAIAAITDRSKLNRKLMWAAGLLYITLMPVGVAFLTHGCAPTTQVKP